MIGILDYNMGNLGSVRNACRYLNLDASLVSRPEELDACTALILPGVGAFGDCMQHLRRQGLVDPIKAWIQADRPFLGICLGLQVLFEQGEESPGEEGLGILPGTVARFRPEDRELKVPQMGWNAVKTVQTEDPLFRGIESGTYFYFVHSFFAPSGKGVPVAATTEYGITYTSAISRGRLMAVQFHPEKSQKAGLTMIENFAEIAGVREAAV